MANPQLFLGIDCGTQGTKAIILDAVSGQVLGQGAAAHKLISGANGRREQDTAQWLDAFTLATRCALLAANVDGQETRRAALVVAAWALYLKGVDENGDTYTIPDPRAEFCQGLVADDALITQRLLAVEEIFGAQIPHSPEFVAAFKWCCNSLREVGVTRTLERVLA